MTPPTVPVSNWTPCNKWIQIASASLNNGDYRVAEKTMGGKTNSVCEDPPIISIKRVQVGPTRVAIGRHQDMPVKIKKRKLPILKQNMLIQIFYSGNCHLCTQTCLYVAMQNDSSYMIYDILYFQKSSWSFIIIPRDCFNTVITCHSDKQEQE